MAERKYDLALVNTKTDKRIREKPWYKERLDTKFIKSLKPSDTSKTLVGKNWIFVKDGLDDFRDGLPPLTQGDILIKGTKGPGPNLTGSGENVSAVKQPAVRRRFTKHQICYSRSTPLQQSRRDHIDEIEYSLIQHPLALYPHLEEAVSAELFEDIVDILDPEMNLDPDEELDDHLEEEDEEEEEGKEEERPETAKSDAEKSQDSNEEGKIRNPYRWLPRKEEREKKDKRKTTEKSASSESQEEHIKKVTKEFCDWVAESLGGDQNKFEESTIMSLFASGYETKPALSVPIHVVELTNVPQELRQQATITQQQANKNLPPPEQKKNSWKYSGQYEPSWVKFQYGAWYLDPKSWTKRKDDEPLENPKETKDKEMSEAKKKSKSLNHVIAQSQGAKLFMDWVNEPKRQNDPKKDHTKPEFLDEVAEIQEQALIEEQKKLKAEQDAKQRKLYLRKRQDTEQSVA
ncbi:hypothetical protein FSP39_025196 [Pinctada imbricata]|uniref:Protein FAM47E n=1 Tax=Pinctada imbricata TaxID=66713 RepID=A0AA88YJR5_PINIB|nr:hypothetical protein FSP39_025196 [Pinctada imbricata]